MQHLRTVHSWKFRLLQSNLGLLRKERLHKPHSPTLSEFRSSYLMQSKSKYPSFYPKQKSVSLSLTVIMVFRENFSSSVHLSGIRIKLQDTHHIFSFDPGYPFSYSRDTTRSSTISSQLLLSQAIFIPRTPSSPLFLLFPFISLPIWRAPIIANRSQRMCAQDRADLLRPHGWPTETEIHVCNWNFLLFSKGHQVLIETLPPVTLTSLYPPSPPTPFMYGEDSLCFPDAKQETDHIKFAPYTKR